ncbi:MAG: hypothetical protein PHR78_01635 [Eubacteriales bacterium]|nr:hypothetical protein [Eubacteriales bacterium]
MKTLKTLSSILLVCCFFISVFALLGIQVEASSQDSVFVFERKRVGYIYFTEERNKDDATGTYVYYVEASGQPYGSYFSVWSQGVNETTNDSGIIYKGQQRKISQYVYEKGKRVCNLGISPRIHDIGRVHGLWSPDSVGSYPYCNLP